MDDVQVQFNLLPDYNDNDNCNRNNTSNDINRVLEPHTAEYNRIGAYNTGGNIRVATTPGKVLVI